MEQNNKTSHKISESLIKKLYAVVGEELMKQYVQVSDYYIHSRFYPSGISSIEIGAHGEYVVTTSFDDLRGPQGCNEYETEEIAEDKFAETIKCYAEHKEWFLYYHPEWKE